jgi:HEAT repeat protein
MNARLGIVVRAMLLLGLFLYAGCRGDTHETAEQGLAKAIRDLESLHAVCRSCAAYRLGELKDAASVEALVKAAGDSDDWTRANAIQALSRIGDRRAIDCLIAALGDRDWRVRFEAVQALEKMPDPRAVEPLARVLGDRHLAGWCAAQVLKKIGAPAVKPIARQLLQGNQEARRNAADALLAIGDPACVEALIGALQDEDSWVRVLAWIALRDITGQAFGEDYAKWKAWYETSARRRFDKGGE